MDQVNQTTTTVATAWNDLAPSRHLKHPPPDIDSQRSVVYYFSLDCVIMFL